MNSHVAIGFAVAIALSGSAAAKHPQATAPTPRPTPAFDTLFSRWTAATPGCAVGVMRDGALVFARGYGMADLASGAPLDERSILGVASLSKHFTAYAIARLAASGRLSTNDDVRRFIPELPDYGSPIRVIHLLNHTSGLRDYLSMIGLAGRNAEGRVSRASALDLIARQRGLNNAPGAAHLYSNTNYYLLALVVERVTRQPFAAYMPDSLFRPLGMTDTRFALDGEVERRQAESYRTSESGRLEQVALDGMLLGEGGAYSTVADMARWERHLRQPAPDADDVVRLFRENGRFGDGRSIDYGWGTQFATYRGVATEAHGGTWGGFRSYYLRMPSLGFAAAVLCNELEISPFQLTRRLADVVVGDRLGPADASMLPPLMPPSSPDAPGPAVPRAVVVTLLGEYHSPELDARYVLAHDGERLRLRVGAQDAVPVAVVHPDTLSAMSRRMIVERDDAGRVTGLVLNSGRVRGVRLVRVAAPPPTATEAPRADTLTVARAAGTPVLDGRVDEREYGPPSLTLTTAAGDVRVWITRRDEHVYIAADLPDSTFYWGDDLVVSLDPLGRGGPAPDVGDRQWYLRRVLDSSVVMTADAGRWYAPGRIPPALGATREHADWRVASTSSTRGWMVELRVRAGVVKPGAAAPRLALRTYNDRPRGWWSWPAPPNDLPAQRVERNPALWVPLRLP